MAKPQIPKDVKEQVNARIVAFNARHHCEYMASYKKGCLFLDRNDEGMKTHVCRLMYKGEIDYWGFAIYKYSDNEYDENEWFPGFGDVDGTVEGAMRAGLKAYTVDF